MIDLYCNNNTENEDNITNEYVFMISQDPFNYINNNGSFVEIEEEK